MDILTMNRIKVDSLILVLWACCTLTRCSSDVDVLSPKLTRCTHERAYDMYGAYCGGLRLEKIPNLKSSIEILDFSENRLNELQASTFTNYPNIKFLYLVENQLYRIDENAFAPLIYLQTLDLSNNVILQLPQTMFQLPSLRNLYLKNNPLLHLSINNLQLRKPINAPLELLDLSNCKLEKLPNWGTLPHLVQYNISHNPLITIDAQHFASMCGLKKVDISKSIDKIENVCELKPTIHWFQVNAISMDLDDYARLNSKEFNECPSMTENDLIVLNTTHHTCRSMYSKFHNTFTSRRTWLKVTGGLAGFLVCFMLLLYIMHRYNVAQTKTPAEKIKKVTPKNENDRDAAKPILNDSSDVSRL
ncbi:leucine-rich repeat-containing protein let-4 [Achroia grisella]|uniref:leucine-rich repeat-containing protein let-4 n=1 Tax=Achroia grisella TaxID=688607 RepID=UPI0027D2642F|nr:leucine-rich repeat-containing protein let-4 [Achroia grisella]